MRGRHIAPTRARTKWGVVGLVLGLFLAMSIPAGANGEEGPNKVWLCHFDTNHQAVSPYSDDRNGTDPGFWTVSAGVEGGTFLVGDYMVRYNSTSYSGVPAGLNPGQIGLCNGNGGEFKLVSVNALGEEDVKGHRAQLQQRNLPTYPDGWKG